MTVPAEKIGDRIRRLRLERGLRQKDLAGDDYTCPYISQIEAGRRRPSAAALQRLAQRLGTTVDELETGRPSDLEPRLRLRLSAARRAILEDRFDDATTELTNILDEATGHGLAEVAARVHEGLGLIAERRGAVEDALHEYETAARLWADAPLPYRVETVAGHARSLQMAGDARVAIHELESYLLELERSEMPDPTALMRVHSTLVGAYMGVGLIHNAARAARDALALEARVEDEAQLANMHVNVAEALLSQGRIADAKYSLRRAEELFTSLGLKHEIARAHIAQGIVLANERRFDDGRAALDAALRILASSPSTLDEARALNELARIERLTGRLDAARGLLRRSMPMLRSTDVAELAMAHRELGLCEAEADDAAAEKHLREAAELYRRAGDAAQVATTCRSLGDLLRARGRVSAAIEAYAEGIAAVGVEPL
ncbi:MAG TPA: helix-turn-helix transcriptional regulator [Actinomycetota bacterium]|nr:helix-turn-helix transcriptional regulator [Actinomycetota bacterium]